MDLLVLLDDLIINFINPFYLSLLLAWWTELLDEILIPLVVLTELFKIKLLSTVMFQHCFIFRSSTRILDCTIHACCILNCHSDLKNMKRFLAYISDWLEYLRRWPKALLRRHKGISLLLVAILTQKNAIAFLSDLHDLIWSRKLYAVQTYNDHVITRNRIKDNFKKMLVTVVSSLITWKSDNTCLSVVLIANL